MLETNGTAEILLVTGGLLLTGLAADVVGRRTPVPRVTLLLLVGIVAGPAVLDLVPRSVLGGFDVIADMALLLIGFLLGERLSMQALRAAGRRVVWLVLGESLGAALAVLGVLWWWGLGLPAALVLAAIAAASAPSATFDVVHEENASGPFTDNLLEIVALDDILGLLLFSVALAFAVAGSDQSGAAGIVVVALTDLVGAVLVGLLVGVPAAFLTGRIRDGEPLLVEALGLVFVCGGLARYWDVSFLVAAMTMGAVIANLAQHHERPFHAIENIEWPFMILFFSLAGMSLDLPGALAAGTVVAVYVVARAGGRIAGCRLGAVIAQAPDAVRRYMGMALLPQAGVAIGMALIAAPRLGDDGALILSIVISATVVFEIIGPVFTRYALRLSGESGRHTPTRPPRG